MPLFVTKQRSPITNMHARTVLQTRTVNNLEFKSDVATAPTAKKELEAGEASLYDPHDSDPFKYQPHRTPIPPDCHIDPSTSFGSTSDASFDDLLPMSSPTNGLDYSILSLSPVGEDASLYGRIHGGEVGGLAFLEKELIREDEARLSIEDESNIDLQGVGISAASEDCTSAAANGKLVSLRKNTRRSVAINYMALRSCFPTQPSLTLNKALAVIESPKVAGTSMDGLGICVLPNSCPNSGVPLERVTRPSKIPRWVSAPSWSSSRTSVELQRVGLGEREASFASSIATTISVGSTTSPRDQSEVPSPASCANPLSSRFTMDSYIPNRKKYGKKWLEPIISRLRKMTSWRQGSSSEGSSGIATEYEAIQQRPLIPRAASSNESTFYYSRPDSPAITLTVRSLSMPNFTSRWSVDWDTVLAGISYNGNDALREVDYFSCKPIQESPSTTSYEVTESPLPQAVVQLQAPPLRPRHHFSRTSSSDKACRRNAGLFDVDVTSTNVLPCIRSSIPRLHRSTPATEGITSPVACAPTRPVKVRTQSTPTTGSSPSNHWPGRALSYTSRIPRYSASPSVRSSVMLTISSTINSFPEPPGCSFQRP